MLESIFAIKRFLFSFDVALPAGVYLLVSNPEQRLAHPTVAVPSPFLFPPHLRMNLNYEMPMTSIIVHVLEFNLNINLINI